MRPLKESRERSHHQSKRASLRVLPSSLSPGPLGTDAVAPQIKLSQAGAVAEGQSNRELTPLVTDAVGP